MPADVELVRGGVSGIGQAAAKRSLDDSLHDLLDDVRVGRGKIVAARRLGGEKGVGGKGDLGGDFLPGRFHALLVVILLILHCVGILIALGVERLRQLGAVAIQGVGL